MSLKVCLPWKKPGKIEKITRNAKETAHLIGHLALFNSLEKVCREYGEGKISCPPRTYISLPEHGHLFSMVASAHDITVHKLILVNPNNRKRDLPLVHSEVRVYDSKSGESILLLDGPTVTERRTAVLSAVGMRHLCSAPPSEGMLIGTGKLAISHLQAFNILFPNMSFWIKATSEAKAKEFCRKHSSIGVELRPCTSNVVPESVDVVITMTSSTNPVYSEPAIAGRLLIGVGTCNPNASEIFADTVRSSQVVIDEKTGGINEAGDLLQAKIDWSEVNSLSDILTSQPDFSRPIFFKTVGCAAWDLAAARVAIDTAR
uniref:Ornithine cyclodeaminase n=1 Tax=Enterobacter asburiae TaxID=61645 RepID=A0A217EU27_ENTAS|nr:delta(1)-pyrroline-2-carboxylate reductase family protein [Enterobacter asburiae]AQZ19808.1 hypothetical protein [Enterobacter asburiae]